ncbi:uncharacterized protein JCM15063_005053 [Sporobolomyces koalae]|uniref:uncharacterized protein n=1 Tax=Sporobolomyces koalae TaxID=500713 RepID=UPI003177EC6A
MTDPGNAVSMLVFPCLSRSPRIIGFLAQSTRASLGRYGSKLVFLLALYLFAPPAPPRVDLVPTKATSSETGSLDKPHVGSNRIASHECGRQGTMLLPHDRLCELGQPIAPDGQWQQLRTSTAARASSETKATLPKLSPYSSTPTASQNLQTIPNRIQPKDSIDSTIDRHDHHEPRQRLPRLTPLTYTLLLLHLIFLLQHALSTTKPSLCEALLSNPLPPPFTLTLQSRAPSLAKRLARCKWTIRLVLYRCGRTLAWHTSWSLVASALSASAVWQALGGRGQTEPGWNAISRFDAIGHVALRGYQAEHDRSAGIKPLREIVLLELCSTLLIACEALVPLLVSLTIIPSTLIAPRRFLLGPSSRLVVPTTYLLPRYLSLTTSSITLAQTLVVIVARPKSSYRFLSCATVATIPFVLSLLDVILRSREAIEKDLRRIEWLNERFSPEALDSRGSKSGSTGDSSDWRLARDVLLQSLYDDDDDEEGGDADEVCGICFENEWEPVVGQRSFQSRLYFSQCRHSVHASCLAEWFDRQSFCPCCHSQVTPLTEFPPSRY